MKVTLYKTWFVEFMHWEGQAPSWDNFKYAIKSSRNQSVGWDEIVERIPNETEEEYASRAHKKLEDHIKIWNFNKAKTTEIIKEVEI